ncbi:hypothetical protein AAGS40_29835 (plasmid) [Paraburkholderia sp. PREW-6R]|uniref:hypothetical protein n=1 Tax=Paraburkholderia sp. PREW-6R TaxID=3141544 RepID=UPI0031F59D63
MTTSQKREQQRTDLEWVVKWLDTHQPATLMQIVADSHLSMADAANALEYGLRHRLVEYDVPPDPVCFDVFRYRLGNRPVAPARACVAEERTNHPFEALLVAWGIALEPPVISSTLSYRMTG